MEVAVVAGWKLEQLQSVLFCAWTKKAAARRSLGL